jgi:hypothetical protein
MTDYFFSELLKELDGLIKLTIHINWAFSLFKHDMNWDDVSRWTRSGTSESKIIENINLMNVSMNEISIIMKKLEGVKYEHIILKNLGRGFGVCHLSFKYD